MSFGFTDVGSTPARHSMITVFGTIALLSAIMVITEKNTVHSVFYLVLSFVNTAVIIIITGVDYIGLLIIIVYVGAIAILFLFVVMMINIKSEEMNRTRYTPIGVIIILVLIMEVYIVYPSLATVAPHPTYMINGQPRNIEAIGESMYS